MIIQYFIFPFPKINRAKIKKRKIYKLIHIPLAAIFNLPFGLLIAKWDSSLTK